MDIVTQGIAGAVLAQSFARKDEVKLAAVAGFFAGIVADADVLFSHSEIDPLLQLQFHRYFSHALIFIPVGGMIAALLLWLPFKRYLSFSRIYLFSVAAYATSGLLDACTSYGTSLYWPFSDERVAWSIISIIDPLFSLPLILFIFYAIRKQQVAIARYGFAFAMGYFLLGFMQHQRAEAAALETAHVRGHKVEHMEVKPTMGNLLLWRSIYESGERFYIDAVRVGLFEGELIPGESVEKFSFAQVGELAPDSVQADDIRRFNHFSNGFIALYRDDGRVIVGDVRYAMLPTSIKPLWGIELDLQQPQMHTPFNSYRDTSHETRARFLDMLFGRKE